MTEQEAQARTCPLCGGDNQCAMAAGRPADTCWCQGVTIDPAALAKVPVASINRHCLCPACGTLKEESTSAR